MKNRKPVRIVIADDDEDDCMMIRDALEQGELNCVATFVENGRELLDLLDGRRPYNNGVPLLPALILLDLNMPVMDGREALRAIKSNPRLRNIPVVALTTSRDDWDIDQSYDLGVNSYITKPVTFDAMVELVRRLQGYWFDVVQFPLPQEGR